MMTHTLKIIVEILLQITIKELGQDKAPLADLGKNKMPKS